MSYDEKAASSHSDIVFVAELVYEEAAIVLSPEKAYLIEARLDSLARKLGFDTTSALVEKVRAGGLTGKDLAGKVVDAMTTNETSFFRDIHPFTALRKQVLPEIIARREADRKLNIWCAACSSGQEPYTIAMLLAAHFPELESWQLGFLASDISEEMLERCRSGRFSKLEVNRGLPASMLVKYFEQDGADWVVKKSLRDRIDFRRINLIGNWPLMPKMDIVFIRNVLIYFDAETKASILKKIRGAMDPHGYLFLGGTETTFNIDTSFHRMRIEGSTVYTLTEKSESLVSGAATATG